MNKVKAVEQVEPVVVSNQPHGFQVSSTHFHF